MEPMGPEPPRFHLMINIAAKTIQAVTEPRFPVPSHNGMTAVIDPDHGVVVEPEGDTWLP